MKVKGYIESTRNYYEASYLTDSGDQNAVVINDLNLSITSYTDGLLIIFKSISANSGACTININSLGEKYIKKSVCNDLEADDILQNQIVTVVYDGTNFQLSGSAGSQLNSYTLHETTTTDSTPADKSITSSFSSLSSFVIQITTEAYESNSASSYYISKGDCLLYNQSFPVLIRYVPIYMYTNIQDIGNSIIDNSNGNVISSITGSSKELNWKITATKISN
jgi:hypothetical protein